MASPTPAPARLLAVSGNVTTVAGKTRTPAEAGQPLPAGATVVSTPHGMATVALPDGTAITIAGDSTYRYAAGGGGAAGQVDVMVPDGRQLRLTAGLADIHGAGPLELRISAPAAAPRRTALTAVSGSADIAYRGGRTRLEKGQRLVLTADAQGRVTPAVT